MVQKDVVELYPRLATRLFPSSDGKTAKLKDGRVLGYLEYTDPACSNPVTVVLLPGTPGSRFFTHPTVAAKGFASGVRLLVLERPGFGLSSPAPNKYMLADFAKDFREFCEAVSIKRACVLGYSAGTPHALAVACFCSDIVAGVAVVSTIGPPETPDVTRGMSFIFKMGYTLYRCLPFVAGWIVASENSAARKNPVRSLRESFKPYTCPKDKEALKRPEVEELFLESLIETSSRKQEGAIHRENYLWTHSWGFDLRKIKIPVAIWQGERDCGTTKEMALYLVEQIPLSHVRLLPACGHMIYFDDMVFGEVLNWITEQIKPSEDAVKATPANETAPTVQLNANSATHKA